MPSPTGPDGRSAPEDTRLGQEGEHSLIPVEKPPPRHRLKRVLLLVGWNLGVTLILVEIASRAFLSSTMGVPFWRTGNASYPELAQLEGLQLTADDEFFDVLFLGGSVLADDVGNVREAFLRRFTRPGGPKIRIHNMALSGHNSQDSFYKYRRLQDVPFDLVFFYHGINDVRANNCPPNIFDEYYGHNTWYENKKALEGHPEIGILTSPWVIHGSILALKQRRNPSRYIPRGMSIEFWEPSKLSPATVEEWIDQGTDVKTERVFRRNLEAIANMARGKGEPLLIATFASYLAEGYSIERFKSKTLDYDDHFCAVELWGRPAGVVRGIAVHNGVIEDAGRSLDNVLLVDSRDSIPKTAHYFRDICHFTDDGEDKFVEALAPTVEPLLESF